MDSVLETATQVLADVQGWVLLLAASAWVYPLVYALCALDGFFPPVPSESVVVALAVAGWVHGTPDLALLALVAVAGAWSGDQVAFRLGRGVDTQRLRLLRGPRGRLAVFRARAALGRRGAAFILAARYVPVGRVAVNMSAGALGYPVRRFVGVSALAAVLWTVTSVVVGVVSGAWLGERPLLAMGVGVAVGLVLGVLLDRVLARVWARRDARAAAAAASTVVRTGAGTRAPGAPGPDVPALTPAVRVTSATGGTLDR